MTDERLRKLFPTIPDADFEQLKRYTVGQIDSTWGIGEHLAILVVDMTRGFVEDSTASTYVPSAASCAENIRKLITRARKSGVDVIFTRGQMIHHEAEAGGWLRGRGMTVLESSNKEANRQIIDSLAPQPHDIVISKTKPSGFFGTNLNAILNYLRVDTLAVTGVSTSGCVRATVNDAFSLNYRVIIPIECVADRAEISHQVELFDMAVKYADVILLDDVLDALDSRPSVESQAAPGTRSDY